MGFFFTFCYCVFEPVGDLIGIIAGKYIKIEVCVMTGRS